MGEPSGSLLQRSTPSHAALHAIRDRSASARAYAGRLRPRRHVKRRRASSFLLGVVFMRTHFTILLVRFPLSRQSWRVLVAEDNELVGRVIVAQFGRAFPRGNIVVASSAEEAERELRERAYDLIIAD